MGGSTIVRRLLFSTAVLAILGSVGLPVIGASRQVSAASNSQIYWGALVSGALYNQPDPQAGNMQAVDTFESHAGKKPSILHVGQSWYTNGVANAFPKQLLDSVRNHGQIPLFTWGSRDPTLDLKNQPAFRNSVITSGTYDSYIRQFATDAKNWGQPFFLRYDWEMNGWWYPWGEGQSGATGQIVNGNQPGDYVKMWRHVYDIFNEVGVTNATWVWTFSQLPQPSPTGTAAPLSQIYPGDNYLDWTSFDAYNRYSGWLSYNTTITGAGTTWLGNNYTALQNLAPTKPIMLAEFGSKEDLSNPQAKADWFTDGLLAQLPNNFPAIKAAVYYNRRDTSDTTNPDYYLPIESSAQSQAAFAKGIASSYYSGANYANLAPGKIQPLPDTVPPAPVVNLLANPSFENSGTAWLSPWSLVVKPGAAATATKDTTTVSDGNSSAKIVTTNTGGVWWYVTLQQANLAVVQGQKYTLSFWAKSASNQTAHAIIQQNYSPYTEYLKQTVNVTPTWQKYTFAFTAPVTDSNLKVGFTTDVAGTLWLDNASLTPTP
jgi:mannan endo-1,4-beta-mannosidase